MAAAAFVLRAGAGGACCALGWARAAPLPRLQALAGAAAAGSALAQALASRGHAPSPAAHPAPHAARSSSRAPCAVAAAAPPAPARKAPAPVAASRQGLLDAVALPPPLVFEAEVVGGEEMMVATLPDIGGNADTGGGAPFFLTRAEHAGLMRYVSERRSDTPQIRARSSRARRACWRRCCRAC